MATSKFAGDLFSATISATEPAIWKKFSTTAFGKKADYADLYFEYRQNEGVSLEEGMVKNCSQSTANGVGVRVLAEAKTGYAYTDDITIENLEIAARTAQYIAQNRPSQCPRRSASRAVQAHDLYPVKTPVNDVALENKIELLYEIDKFARALDPRVKNVFVSLGSEYKVILVATSQGIGRRRYPAADPAQCHLHRRRERQPADRQFWRRRPGGVRFFCR